MTTHSPKFNSHEAFAEWFNDDVLTLVGMDWTEAEEVMKLWCSKNNHRYEEDGVYNDNIRETKLNEKNAGSKEQKMSYNVNIYECECCGKFDYAMDECCDSITKLHQVSPDLANAYLNKVEEEEEQICSKCPLPLTENDMNMGDGTMCEGCFYDTK